jgi:hypothetical protein
VATELCLVPSSPSFAKRHIHANKKTQDGMQAWVAIVHEFDMGGDRNVLIEKYKTQVSTKYHCNYTGWMLLLSSNPSM